MQQALLCDRGDFIFDLSDIDMCYLPLKNIFVIVRKYKDRRAYVHEYMRYFWKLQHKKRNSCLPVVS